MKNCSTCKHSGEVRQPGEVVSQLACRRYPPNAFPTQHGVIVLFTPVTQEMLCGEWAEKETMQ